MKVVLKTMDPNDARIRLESLLVGKEFYRNGDVLKFANEEDALELAKEYTKEGEDLETVKEILSTEGLYMLTGFTVEEVEND